MRALRLQRSGSAQEPRGAALLLMLLPMLILSSKPSMAAGAGRGLRANSGAAAGAPSSPATCAGLLQATAAGADTSFIDPDTPAASCTKRLCNSTFAACDQNTQTNPPLQDMVLVFSDEFERAGRNFSAGCDSKWQALNLHYLVNGDQAAYKPDAISVANGSAVITVTKQTTTSPASATFGEVDYTLPYRSGMMQSWNKFCYTGGYLEVRLVLPGGVNHSGLWPAVWLMGNLGRAGYVKSTQGLWPYSYDVCDGSATGGVPWSSQEGQRVNRCNSTKGRGASEIDLFEVGIWTNGKPSMSTSLQLAPLMPTNTTWLDLPGGVFFPTAIDANPNSTFHTRPNDWAGLNSYPGHPRPGTSLQDALSAVSNLDASFYSSFHTYGVDWVPGNYLRWYIDDVMIYELNSAALKGVTNAANQSVGDRMIPYEPSYLIMNVALSDTFTLIDPNLPLPASMEIDYVRVYQYKGSINTGCSPPDFPTAEFISCNLDKYVLSTAADFVNVSSLPPCTTGRSAAAAAAATSPLLRGLCTPWPPPPPSPSPPPPLPPSPPPSPTPAAGSDTASSSASASADAGGGSSGPIGGMMLGVIGGGAGGGILIVALVVWWVCCRRRRPTAPSSAYDNDKRPATKPAPAATKPPPPPPPPPPPQASKSPDKKLTSRRSRSRVFDPSKEMPDDVEDTRAGLGLGLSRRATLPAAAKSTATTPARHKFETKCEARQSVRRDDLIGDVERPAAAAAEEEEGAGKLKPSWLSTPVKCLVVVAAAPVKALMAASPLRMFRSAEVTADQLPPEPATPTPTRAHAAADGKAPAAPALASDHTGLSGEWDSAASSPSQGEHDDEPRSPGLASMIASMLGLAATPNPSAPEPDDLYKSVLPHKPSPSPAPAGASLAAEPSAADLPQEPVPAARPSFQPFTLTVLRKPEAGAAASSPSGAADPAAASGVTQTPVVHWDPSAEISPPASPRAQVPGGTPAAASDTWVTSSPASSFTAATPHSADRTPVAVRWAASTTSSPPQVGQHETPAGTPGRHNSTRSVGSAVSLFSLQSEYHF